MRTGQMLEANLERTGSPQGQKLGCRSQQVSQPFAGNSEKPDV